MWDRPVGLLLVAVGVGIALIGLIVWSGGFGWFGNLPGDIRIERESTRIYIPITSMLVISVGLSVVIYIIRRFFG